MHAARGERGLKGRGEKREGTGGEGWGGGRKYRCWERKNFMESCLRPRPLSSSARTHFKVRFAINRWKRNPARRKYAHQETRSNATFLAESSREETVESRLKMPVFAKYLRYHLTCHSIKPELSSPGRRPDWGRSMCANLIISRGDLRFFPESR